jgi:hypothetical protein
MLIAAMCIDNVRYELYQNNHSYTLMYGSKVHTYHAATDEEALLIFSRLVGKITRR